LEDDVLAEALLQDLAELADAVGKAEGNRAAARPEGTGKKVGIVYKRRAAARLDDVDKVGVDLLLQGSQPDDIGLLLRLERVEHRLAPPGGVHAPLDPDPVEELRKAEARRDHADRAHDRAPVDDDLVAGQCQDIAPRGSDILDRDEDPFLLFGSEHAE